METINGIINKEEEPIEIILENTEALSKAYELIMKEEDFMLEDPEEERTTIIIASNLLSKLKNGEIILLREE
jgi:hypothetical protein